MLTVETEREEDGRWIAEITALPGVLSYGESKADAIAKAEALALRVLADRVEHGEAVPEMEPNQAQGRPRRQQWQTLWGR